MTNEKNGAKNEMEMKQNETMVVASLDVNKYPKMVVERKPFTSKDGRKMYGYVVVGKIFGREVKVDFSAKDQGGYEVLDIIFMIKPTAELVIHDEEMTDTLTGQVTRYTVYEVQNIDNDGNVYSYKVKPARESDKSLLQMLIRQKQSEEKAQQVA